MKVILTQTVSNLGHVGQIVTVKNGYGRNFLIPRGLAVVADERNRKVLAHQQKTLSQQMKKELADAEVIVEKIESLSITLTRKAGENEKLFGSVTNQDIHEALVGEGVTIDRRQIDLKDPIKALGYFTVPVKMGQGKSAQLKLWVVAENSDGVQPSLADPAMKKEETPQADTPAELEQTADSDSESTTEPN